MVRSVSTQDIDQNMRSTLEMFRDRLFTVPEIQRDYTWGVSGKMNWPWNCGSYS